MYGRPTKEHRISENIMYPFGEKKKSKHNLCSTFKRLENTSNYLRMLKLHHFRYNRSASSKPSQNTVQFIP